MKSILDNPLFASGKGKDLLMKTLHESSVPAGERIPLPHDLYAVEFENCAVATRWSLASDGNANGTGIDMLLHETPQGLLEVSLAKPNAHWLDKDIRHFLVFNK